MLTRLLIASVAALALALAPQAAAKGIEGATVCGVDACASADRDDLGPALMGGTPTMPPTEAAPWYRSELEMGDGRPGGRVYETFRLAVLPQSGYIRMRDGHGGWSWSEMSSAQQAIYTRVTDELEPFAAAELEGVADPEPVAEVAPAPATGDSGGGPGLLPWLAIAAAVAALGGAMWALGLGRRRRGRSDSGRSAAPLPR